MGVVLCGSVRRWVRCWAMAGFRAPDFDVGAEGDAVDTTPAPVAARAEGWRGLWAMGEKGKGRETGPMICAIG